MPRVNRIRDLISLTKPRVTAMVVLTALGGAALAPGSAPLLLWLAFAAALAALVGSANALNCWMERDSDALMARTRGRPLPAGRMRSTTALGFGLSLALLALPVLALVNALTATLGAFALVSYVWAYTPLKRRSSAALYVGALPGALAPLMGWTAVTGGIDVVGLALAAILFVWQVPHFLIIALRKRAEYARAGLAVFPVVHGERATRWLAFATAVSLVPLSLSLWWLGAASAGYAAVVAIVGAMLVSRAARCLDAAADSTRMRRFYLATLTWVMALVVALVVDVAVA